MLTKNDLVKVGEVIDVKLKPVKSDLAKIGQVIDKRLDVKLKPIKMDIKQIKKDLEFVVGSLDKDRWNLEKKFEIHTEHPPRIFPPKLNISDIQVA